MFTLDQIKAAHSKVKSGADFPGYVQELIRLGVVSYDTYVSDGHTKYNGENNYTIQADAKYLPMDVAAISDSEQFRQYLKIHQQGQTDYPLFCKHAAETGVEKWTVDMIGMTCSYYDKAGNKLLVENIPQR